MCFYHKVHIYNLQSVNLFLRCHGEKTFSPAELYHCVCVCVCVCVVTFCLYHGLGKKKKSSFF